MEKSTKQIIDYLKNRVPLRDQVADDEIEHQFDIALSYSHGLIHSVAKYRRNIVERLYVARFEQRSKIKGYTIERLKFQGIIVDYQIALGTKISDPKKHQLKYARGLKEIKREIEEKSQHPQTPPEK